MGIMVGDVLLAEPFIPGVPKDSRSVLLLATAVPFLSSRSHQTAVSWAVMLAKDRKETKLSPPLKHDCYPKASG